MTEPAARPRLLYLVTEDWYFVSHRLPMARAAAEAGYDVHVATRVQRHRSEIESEGFTLHALDWHRGRVNPIQLLKLLRDVRRLYRLLRPAIVHHVAMEPVVVGSLAALGLPIVRLNAITGLGFAFTTNTPKAVLTRAVMNLLMRIVLRGARAVVLVQNPDDRRLIEALRVPAHRIFLIAGSGVDAKALTPLAEPEGPVSIAYVGRLIESKGLPTLIAAHELLLKRGIAVPLLLAGDQDPANPGSISSSEIERWRRLPGVSVLGYVADIGSVWARAHIAVLPSQREGLPKSLIEAAACARPIISSDVPGCREIARKDVNALVVPVNDAPALAAAIERLASDPTLRRTLGDAGRQLVEGQFANDHIGRQSAMLYDHLLGRTRDQAG